VSEKCRCGQPSKGSVGLIRWCLGCIAKQLGWGRQDRRLRERVLIELHNDGRHIGVAEWIPDCARRTRAHS
jgi:hypothetical protein